MERGELIVKWNKLRACTVLPSSASRTFKKKEGKRERERENFLRFFLFFPVASPF